ncbi:GLPGLI family protein [Chryseobacterium sp. RU37D]|uniref:GLPGLI family protein n=1 Tax=Chryseobacterium sp. RU37D TaxID=1907397 RepID=UPI000953D7C0|nr:GLPGLI family protein [Chryseobacterium sp. RU37D]SIQ38009.1 GLPGLI family protein [Chryseobacterium sp. RU37D]
MKFFLLNILTFVFISISGQNFKLLYNLEFVHDTINNKRENKQMVLWIDKDSIVFCSNELINRDSINQENNEDIYVSSDEIDFMTIKDKNYLYKYHFIDNYLYKNLEKNEILDWNIKNEIKKINGFTCQLATLKYKGRIWEAWFDKSYTISYGPYVFHGLPGLIVQLHDLKNNYNFSLQKVVDSKKKISQSFFAFSNKNFPKALVVNNNQLKKLYLTHYSNPYRRMKEKKIIYMIDEKTGEHQPPPDFDKLTKSAQKYIRDNNNPIELSEAVKYP